MRMVSEWEGLGVLQEGLRFSGLHDKAFSWFGAEFGG